MFNLGYLCLRLDRTENMNPENTQILELSRVWLSSLRKNLENKKKRVPKGQNSKEKQCLRCGQGKRLLRLTRNG